MVYNPITYDFKTRLTCDLERIDASDRGRRDALVHARLVSSVEQVPDIDAAILFADIEHRWSAWRPVPSCETLWRCGRTKYWTALKEPRANQLIYVKIIMIIIFQACTCDISSKQPGRNFFAIRFSL